MRIPYPERFKVKTVVIFATTLFIAQLLEKTDPTFALLSFLYVIIFALAFNAGGGFRFLAGSFIFFNGILSCILGITYKAVLREPGQTHLLNPNRTMLAYCIGMAGMGLAAGLSRRLIPRNALLSSMAAGDRMRQAALGCLIVGIVIQLTSTSGFTNPGSIASALNQVNHFIQMAIILGTTYNVISSEGKRSTSWVVIIACAWLFFFGVINFSKEGMLIAPVAYILPAVALRFNWSKTQLIGGAFAFFILFHYLVPFSQYGRSARTESGGANAGAAIEMLRHPEGTRKLYLETAEAEDDEGAPHFYDSAQGLFDREQMLAFDDALIHFTDEGNVHGTSPVFAGFANTIPHFLWKDKPSTEIGNEYGREIGVLSSEDETTGISFSPVGDAYHEATWVGVAIVLPAVLFLLFFIADSLAGDILKSPWNLLLIALSAHIAPEGLLQGPIYLMTFGAFALIVIALLARFALPVLSNLLTGSERTRVRRTVSFQPVVRGARLNATLRSPIAAAPFPQLDPLDKLDPPLA